MRISHWPLQIGKKPLPMLPVGIVLFAEKKRIIMINELWAKDRLIAQAVKVLLRKAFILPANIHTRARAKGTDPIKKSVEIAFLLGRFGVIDQCMPLVGTVVMTAELVGKNFSAILEAFPVAIAERRRRQHGKSLRLFLRAHRQAQPKKRQQPSPVQDQASG